MTFAFEHPLVQLIGAFTLGAMAVAAAGIANAANEKDCKVIERPAAAASQSGTVSSSVTAGGGKVSAHSTGGNSVTVHSGNGSVASSVTTTGSGGSTIVTNSDGSCVIYRNKKD